MEGGDYESAPGKDYALICPMTTRKGLGGGGQKKSPKLGQRLKHAAFRGHSHHVDHSKSAQLGQCWFGSDKSHSQCGIFARFWATDPTSLPSNPNHTGPHRVDLNHNRVFCFVPMTSFSHLQCKSMSVYSEVRPTEHHGMYFQGSV